MVIADAIGQLRTGDVSISSVESRTAASRLAVCRFGGIEGLRGMCIPRVVVQDRMPALMKTALPPPLQYPVASYGFQFVHALCKMFYGSTVAMRVSGLLTLARVSIFPPQARAKQA